MARPTTNTVDYFSHDCQHKQTIFILESRYGNNGYAFWFKLLEMLGATPDHFIDCNNDVSCEFLAAKTNSTWCFCSEVLDLLAKLQAICPDLWTQKIVWSQKFVDRLAGVYKKRGKKSPVKPNFCNRNNTIPVVPVTETPQSKVKDSIVTLTSKSNDAIASSEFDEFWKAYPKKECKKGALKKFSQIIKAKEATAEQLISGAKGYCKKVAGKNPQYTKQPTTWLNNGCWNDEESEAILEDKTWRSEFDPATPKAKEWKPEF